MTTLALLFGLAYKTTKKEENENSEQMMPMLAYLNQTAECARYSDKFIDVALNKIEEGVKEMQVQIPGIQKPNINYGLRGTRYFIEFPITGKNIDAFSILSQTQQLIRQKGPEYGSRVISTDSYIQDENVSYMIDYEVASTTATGGKNKGSIYIRGIKGEGGFDSYKFVLEKSVDFHDLDV